MAELGAHEETDRTDAAALTGFRFRNNVPDVCCFDCGDIRLCDIASVVLVLPLGVGEAMEVVTVGCFLVNAMMAVDRSKPRGKRAVVWCVPRRLRWGMRANDGNQRQQIKK